MKVSIHTISSCLNIVESEELKAQVQNELNSAVAASGNEPLLSEIINKATK